MASYKVPQDVEADDKLLGPFSFRQFIYLVIVALAAAMAWFLAQLFIGLIIIPLPVIIFFAALALPLRKDQPMEIYLAAMVKFFLKPRVRLWQPEGQVNLVTIVAPHVNETSQAPVLSRTEAQQRLSYLARVIDTQGWASRGVTDTAMSSLNDTVTAEASMVDDVLDSSVGIGRQFDSLIEQQDEIRHRQVTQQFQTAMQQPVSAVVPAVVQPVAPAMFPVTDQPAPTMINNNPAGLSAAPVYNPYPSAMHQHVIDPRGQRPPVAAPTRQQPDAYAPTSQQPPITASDTPPSADIMRLANNKDLSISAIAREAHRLEDDEEVVISLR
jgi:hypothetical protein